MPCAEAAYRLATPCLCILVAVGVWIACATPGDADASELIYSPWSKFCIGSDMCIVGADVRSTSECSPVVAAAALFERAVETKRTLRVRLPNVRAGDEVRIRIDQGPSIQRLFEKCDASSCTADYEAAPELVEQLKHGQMLVLDVTDANNSPIRATLPLAGFAEAYDGPPVQPKVFELKQGALQEELERRARRRFCTSVRFLWVPNRPTSQLPSVCSTLSEAEAKPPIRRCR